MVLGLGGGCLELDPIEVAPLDALVDGTAFPAFRMIQEKKSMFKQWNMLLIILTYSLVIPGTFLARTGVLSSIHAFSQSSMSGFLCIFIGLTLIISIALLTYRWRDLKAEVEMSSWLSREALSC